ncbi:hypothetical protein CK203_071194 [Vitis vinifera]|uniref:Uncharacterized protein n=1 Tax=Vitis vinifera TaxID=29760 RepID=A0A438DS75_VITVI|nr:hypothetical protein CK203_071194 [Vitis vinifera]
MGVRKKGNGQLTGDSTSTATPAWHRQIREGHVATQRKATEYDYNQLASLRMRVSSSHISSHVSPPSSPPSPFIPFSLFSFSPPPLLYSLLDVKAFQFPQMEPLEDDDLQPLGSEHELDSTGSGVSSILGTEDARSTTSSGGDISVTSSSSGEYLAAVVAEAVVPRMENPTPASYSGGSGGETTVTVAAREKCVGRNNKGVTWGFTSVIGRRREMEDAVAVVRGSCLARAITSAVVRHQLREPPERSPPSISSASTTAMVALR